MSLATFAVGRPVGVVMLTLIVALFGLVSLLHLPIDLMPDITYPTISLSATYQNASPVEVETLITRPIEQALAAVPGVQELSSTSSEGRCQVRVTFTWGTDLDAAANDIRDRLDRVLARLPEGVERPTLRKFDLAAFPVLVLGAAGNLDPVEMLKLVEDQVKYRVERIPGVASLDINGGQKREIHVNLDVARLKALNLRPDEVVARLKAENLSLPAGIIEAGNYEFIVRTPGEYVSLAQLEDTVIKEDGGALVRLRDAATVVDRWQKIRQLVRVNGKPGLRLMVSKQSGKNTVEVAEAVMAEIERLNRDLPQLHISPIVDSSKYIRRSIQNVSSSAFYGGILAVMVLLVFLRDVRSTLIIATSIPTSIVATFALMYYYGFTLNIMSMGGVALGIGMLVDNSIVVLEVIFRRCERGESRLQAALAGANEVAAPVLASTATTVVVFLPLLFVEGMTGIMFKQLSMVVGFSLLCSLVLSLTLVPMLASRLITVGGGGGGFSARAGERGGLLGAAEAGYRGALALVLDHPLVAGMVVAGALAAAALGAVGIPTEFMPTADEGEVRVSVELEVGSRLSLTEEKVKAIEALIDEHVPERETVVASAGGGGMGGGGHSSGANQAEFRIPLVPKSQRARSTTQVAAALRKALASVPGIKARVREGGGLFIFRMGAGNADKVQLQVRGHDFDTADALAKKVQGVLVGIEGITDVRLSREAGAPERLVAIDRQRAADLRLTVSRTAQFLETLLSGTRAGYFRDRGDEYQILVKATDPERLSLDQILDFTLLNAAGQPVALRNLATTVPRLGPQLIERLDQERIVNVTGDPGGRPLGPVLEETRQALRAIPLPEAFGITFGGDYEEQVKSFRDLLLSLILAVLLVYMVMAVQYESLLDPLIVIVTVPLSAVGVVAILRLTGTTFSVQSFIGCIMLGGIVVNNSILLVDHANHLYREQGRHLREALLEAGRDRLRPVLMTTATTMLGLAPMALGLGEGGEVQAPMARVVIGGLCFSTFVTLLFIPVVYATLARFAPRKEPAHAA